MREIAGLGAGAHHHLSVHVDQAVEVVHHRLHFERKALGQMRCPTGADGAKGGAKPRHGLEAEHHLQGRRRGECDGEQDQRYGQRDVEGPQDAVDDSGIHIHLQAQGIVCPLRQQQALVDDHGLRPVLHDEPKHLVHRQRIGWNWQIGGADGRGFDQQISIPAHLPGIARPLLGKARIAERPV